MRFKQIIRSLLKSLLSTRKIIILAPLEQGDMAAEILSRLDQYMPELKQRGLVPFVCPRLTLLQRITATPILSLLGPGDIPACLQRLLNGIFFVNYQENSLDGWQWHDFLSYMDNWDHVELKASRKRFNGYLTRLRKLTHDKSYIFGTGKSLEKAIDRDWGDGYRIVCNTIVRDRELWHHVEPHFIVAGDAIYHFGHTEFARAFRKDLRLRLQESETMLVYPAVFHAFMRREFASVCERLIPVEIGGEESFHSNLEETFELPALGNVLGLLLLPLACTLSRQVYMIGFDGRAPDDKLFWSNSEKHSYPELMYSLQQAHPAFFETFMPRPGTDSYVKKYHGDKMDELMTRAENEGWTFIMMHNSWTETFQKRYVEGLL